MKLFEKNVGKEDKIVRALAGLAILAMLAIGQVGEPWYYLLAIVMLALFFTAATGSCTLYSLLGVSTCKISKKK